MSFLSRRRSCEPPYLVDPAVVAAMSTDAELPEPKPAVDPVQVLDQPAAPGLPAFDWTDPGIR